MPEQSLEKHFHMARSDSLVFEITVTISNLIRYACSCYWILSLIRHLQKKTFWVGKGDRGEGAVELDRGLGVEWGINEAG